jgi:hypothetical protein
MRANAGILLIIGLMFLAGTVSAVGIPDTLIVTTDKPWIIANNVDQSTITVKVTNTTSPDNGDVQGVTVNLEVDPLYGTLSPIQVTTNLSGMASSTFKVNTKSGAAQINATITAQALSDSTIQDIDHNSAYFADFTHPMNGTVASEVPFNISLTDQYRNPVDNRRGNHIVNLHVHGPFPDDCGFAEAGYAHDISPILDANGNTTVNVKLTSKIGDNNIAMDAYESIPNQLAWISAEAIGKPFSMTQVYSPSGSPPTLPADGVKYFTIIYNLYDEYGNPTNKQFIWVNTSVFGEEQKQYLSNNMGQVTLQYGPRSSIGEIDIVATSVGNNSVNCSQRVKFKNTAAEIISLTANPDTMPSLDVNPSFTSNVIATIADQSGNAVAGETVDFAIEDISYNPYILTANPLLLTTSAITDEYGQALVQFRPGSFTTIGNPGYNATATGQCRVNATWKNTNKTVTATWKNYPYLSVSTKVTPLTVEINKTIDVTIEFRGDGWALQPSPIDVVLVIDRSGSMEYCVGSNSNCPSPNRRLDFAKIAAKTFVTQMDQSRDQIGVVSYAGYTSGTGTRTDIPLSHSQVGVNNAIDSLNATGATETREALKRSIDLLNASPNSDPNAKQAIILMTDGDYNWKGNPLGRGTARGSSYSFSTNSLEPNNFLYYSGLGCSLGATNCQLTEQNMSIYAKNNNIRLYMIGFASTLDPQGVSDMKVMANATGGFYDYAPDATKLNEIYTKIAGDLKDTAGVNTTMTADFDKVNVTGFAMEGDQVYDYVYHPTESTKIRWQDGITNVTNQSDDWRADSQLDFNIGTIKVGQYWNATFRLKVNQSGLIDVFGKNSTVSFNNNNEILYLPQTFITVVPNLTVTEIMVKTITLDNLTCTETGEIKALIPVMWNTNYTGNKTLTEKVFYRIDDKGPWVQFDIKTHPYDPLTMEYVDYAQLDVTKLPPGSYQIMVYATASDTPDATKMLSGPVVVGNRGKTYIKLE